MTSRRETASVYRRLHKRRQKLIKWLIWLLIIAATLGAGYGGYHWWHLRHQTMMAKYPVTGAAIDQSAGFIDFQALSKTGIKFIYLRTTVGNRYLDDDFSGNYSRSSGSSLNVGVYLTYSPSSSVDSQVDYFEHQVGNSTGTLPIMIAVTDAGANFDSAQARKRTANRLSTMMQTLHNTYNQPVGVWVSDTGYAALKKELNLHSVTLEDSKLGHHDPKAVQFIMYDQNGSIEVAGERQAVNLMVYNGSKQSFTQFNK